MKWGVYVQACVVIVVKWQGLWRKSEPAEGRGFYRRACILWKYICYINKKYLTNGMNIYACIYK